MLWSYGSLLVGGKIHIQQSDFTVYLAAAHLVATGHGGGIYNFPVLAAEQHRMFHALLLPRTEAVFLYPPYVAVLLVPLAVLPYGAAYAAWAIFNCLLMACVLFALQRYLALRGPKAVLLWVAGLSFFPVFGGLVQGQLSIVELALLTLSFLALEGRHDRIAGVALAVALIKPTYILPLLLVLLLQRKWEALSAFGAAAVGLLLVPMLVLGRGSAASYLGTLREAAGWHTKLGGFSAGQNHNLWGFTHLLLAGGAATAVQMVLSAAATAILIAVAFRTPENGTAAALALVAGVLVSTHVLLHDLTLLLLPAAVALHQRSQHGAALATVFVAGYCAVLLGFLVEQSLHLQVTVLVIGLLGWHLALGKRLPSTAVSTRSSSAA